MECIFAAWKDYEAMKDTNVQKVIDSFKYREERGMLKYGVNTDRTDLNTMEWLQHLQEELMDACVYVEKLKTEMFLIQEKKNGRDR